VIARLMERIDGLIDRRRGWVIGAWLVLFVAAVPFSLHQTDHLVTSGAIVPGSASQIVDTAARDFPRASENQQGVLLRAAPGTDRASVRRAERRVRKIVKGIPDIRVQAPAVTPGARPLPRSLTFVPLTLKGDQDRRVDAAVKLRKELGLPDEAKRDGVTPYVVGQDGLWAALHGLQKDELKAAESVGFPVTLIILLFVFGALAAAALPIVLAAISVTLTGAVVYFLSLRLNMSLFVTNAASMVGIGVAIDYSLFVLARYRQEIAGGRDEQAARRAALGTSGAVVVFSGLTVIAALAGILLVDSTLLRSMAVGMVVVVGVSIAGAVTLTPALIDRFGKRVYGTGKVIDKAKRGLRRIPSKLSRRPAGGPDFWTRWTERVTRRPLLSVLVAGAFMLVLALPAVRIQMTEGAQDQIPADNEALVGVTLAAHSTGPGRQGPIQTLIRFRRGPASKPSNRRALARYVKSLRARPHVVAVDRPLRSSDPRERLLTVVPRTAADTPQSRALLDSLRSEVAGRKGIAAVADVNVGGATALPSDFVTLIENSMWKIVVFIVLLSFVILLVMLRSLLLPLKAILMTGLSVAASYGVLVAVFQWGWLDGLLGYDSPGHVDATAPPLLLAIVFGLSMDYEVFLLSRIREHMTTGTSTHVAVARGLRSSAGTISSAAMIMVSVFAVFALVGLPSIKQFGTGLAVAIFLDATIVRLVLVPATMDLLGPWNWWLPAWLKRLLPSRPADREAAPAPAPSPPPAPVPTMMSGEPRP
jgi:uncharacterized membrane protein YdfJ with MMPL/SSD domain